MTNQTQVSVPANSFSPRDYDVFAGLDVDHHSIAATFSYFRIVKPFNARLKNSWLAFSFSAEAPVPVSST
jgi:hypothetical protein